VQKKRALPEPKPGIYYMVPDPKTKKYEVYSQIEEPGEDPVHLYLWDRIAKILTARFGVPELDAYRGLPRGRVMAPSERTGLWIIAHGNDIDLNIYGPEILSEFGLRDSTTLNKILWEHDSHEEMSIREKSMVETACKFKFTKTGILPVRK
jgi:hypothetical protein